MYNFFFDLDGTLIDASERLYKLFQELIPESNLSKERYWGLKRSKINHQMILERYFPTRNFKEFEKKWMDMVEDEKYLNLDRRYDDTYDVLEWISFKGNRIILMTDRQSKPHLINELERLNIKKCFDLILVTEKKLSKKELVERALSDHLIIGTQQDLFVSDMGSDIKIGRELGYVTIGITHGFMSRKFLQEYKPDWLIDKLSDLRDIEFI